MDHNQLNYFLLPEELDRSVGIPARSELSQLLTQTLVMPPTRTPSSVQSAHSMSPALVELSSLILQELETHLPRLLNLNPSRRDSIARYLTQNAGLPPLSPQETPTALRKWIEGPRTPAQNSALQSYFEEVAWIVLGQALVLKAWSDRGIRPWSPSDLGRLNWALSTALKPQLPLDREGWLITRPSLYSWYNPCASIQTQIWQALEGPRLSDEGPSVLSALLNPLKSTKAKSTQYDARFFSALWLACPRFGFDPLKPQGPLRKAPTFFSPTIRDGSMIRSGPSQIAWVGTEDSLFQLILAEIALLWWGPAPPPLWSQGNGLEVHARDQLSLALESPKPSLLSRIADMEACEAAIVLEENCARPQGKSPESQRLREQLENLGYFKKIRSARTSLGTLQACVATTKLRPGGLLWWAREESLSATDEGSEALRFLLERTRLVCEWDFSELGHSLSFAGKGPLFPKSLYLFCRDADVERRLSHRPIKVSVHGQLKSHVEFTSLLEDSLQVAPHQEAAPREHWRITTYTSPIPQKEWAERWPDPTASQTFRTLERLRDHSVPLANAATIRSLGRPALPTPMAQFPQFPQFQGFSVEAVCGVEGRRLEISPLPLKQGTGFSVLVTDSSWIAPLTAYLKSETVRSWLDQYAERKADRWILTEQVMKWIPIPKALLEALGYREGDSGHLATPAARPLPGLWEKISADISIEPLKVKEALLKPGLERPSLTIHSSIYARAARALEQLVAGNSKLSTLVGSEGRIRWGELMNILPSAETTPVTVHPGVRVTGSLPPHLPIHRFEKVKMPSAGILLSTEAGFNLHLSTQNPQIQDMLWDQLEGLTHPTWNELVHFLRLPRRLELAQATASDLLRAHGEQARRAVELDELLNACQLF